MKEHYIVGFDDTEAARRTIDFAQARAKASGGSILLLYVLEWSPYSFLTNEELAERHARRKAELGRAEAMLAPHVDRLRGEGVECESLVRYGNPAELICKAAEEHDATQIMIGRSGDSTFMSRFVGSLVLTLAQASPVPLTVVP